MGRPGDEESWRERYFVRKPLGPLQEEVARSALKRSLTAFDLTLLGVGGTIGAGIFVVIGQASTEAGPAITVSFLVAGLVSLLAGLAYAEMAAMAPAAGSAYTYAYLSVGELLGWLVAWNLVIEYMVGNTAVAIGWSAGAANLLEAAGLALPSYLLATPSAGGIMNLPAALIVLAITALLIRGTKESAETNWVLVGVKVAILFVFLALAAPDVDTELWEPYAPFGVGGIFTGAALVFFAFIGFDAVSTAAEETKNPQRDIPRALFASLAITTAIYVAVAAVITGIVPYGDLGVGDPLATGLETIGRSGYARIMDVGAIFATTSVLLVFQLGMPRIFFSLARDGLLPKRLTAVHPRYGTPHLVTLVTGLLTATMAALFPMDAMVALTNISTLFAFLVVLVGVIAMRRAHPDARRPFRAPLMPWAALLGVAICVALMGSLGAITWLRFAGWMGLGLAVYGFYGARNSALRRREADRRA